MKLIKSLINRVKEEQMLLKLGFVVASENNSDLEKQLKFNDFNSIAEINVCVQLPKFLCVMSIG